MYGQGRGLLLRLATSRTIQPGTEPEQHPSSTTNHFNTIASDEEEEYHPANATTDEPTTCVDTDPELTEPSSPENSSSISSWDRLITESSWSSAPSTPYSSPEYAPQTPIYTPVLQNTGYYSPSSDYSERDTPSPANIDFYGLIVTENSPFPPFYNSLYGLPPRTP